MKGPDPDQARQDLGGLAGLPGLETVTEQLAGVIAVVKAEVARRDAGVAVARPAWKNLVFAGGPGSGKSRAAAAVGRIYRSLGVLSSGHLIEAAAAGLTGATSRETDRLVREAASRARGGMLMITDTHNWASLRADDQRVLQCLQDVLAERSTGSTRYGTRQVSALPAGLVLRRSAHSSRRGDGSGTNRTEYICAVDLSIPTLVRRCCPAAAWGRGDMPPGAERLSHG